MERPEGLIELLGGDKHGGAYAFLYRSEKPDEIVKISGPLCSKELLEELRPLSDSEIGVKVGDMLWQNFSAIPFCQIRERGFKVRDGGEKILSMDIKHAQIFERQEFLQLLESAAQSADQAVAQPAAKRACTTATDQNRDANPTASTIEKKDNVACGVLNSKYDYTEEEYEKMVERIYEDEIRGGQGSSFVTPRTFSCDIKDFTPVKPLLIFRQLLSDEIGSYWTFLFYDGADKYFVGASPERHLTVANGRIAMNPISGTFRKSLAAIMSTSTGDTSGKSDTTEITEIMKSKLLEFLGDKKEIDELFMVTDEELKMMCRISPEGGTIKGPFLKDMSFLVHTEYELEALAEGKDVIDSFRLSMFAPTVTGSPIANACNRMHDYEPKSRGYYSSALVLTGIQCKRTDPSLNSETPPNITMVPFLDSCITIRTMEISSTGHVLARVGATLVKDSIPIEEVRETEAKIKGVVTALQRALFAPQQNSIKLAVPPPRLADLFESYEESKTLSRHLLARNGSVSEFWMADKSSIGASFKILPDNIELLKDKTVLLMHNEDDFIYMTHHILLKIGMKPQTVMWQDFEANFARGYQPDNTSTPTPWDLVVIGPGVGDPRTHNSKMSTVRSVIRQIMTFNAKQTQGAQKFMCICLGHQCLFYELGCDLVKKTVPLQGVQRTVNLFGVAHKLGFYNSFHVSASSALTASRTFTELCIDDESDSVIAAKGQHFASFQFHPESILSQNGYQLIVETISDMLRPQ